MVLGLGGASLPPRHKRAAANGSGAAVAGAPTGQQAGGVTAARESSALPHVQSSSGLAGLHAAQVGAGAALNGGAEGAVETPTVDTPVQELAASDLSCSQAARAAAGAAQLGAAQQQQQQVKQEQRQQQVKQEQQQPAQMQAELLASALREADRLAAGGSPAQPPAQASQQAVAGGPGYGAAPAAAASSAGGRKRSRPGSQHPEQQQQQQQQRPAKAQVQVRGGPFLPARPSRLATSRGPSPAPAEEQLAPAVAAALPSSSRKRGASVAAQGAESAGGAAEGAADGAGAAAPPAKRARGGARGGRSPGGGRGRGRGGRGGNRISKYADVLHRMVQVPGAVFFDTKSFLGRVTKAEGRRSVPSVEVLFVDDPQRYWFPVAEVRQWMADMVQKGTWERFNPGVPPPDFRSILAASAADAAADGAAGAAGKAAGKRGRGGGAAAAAGQQAEEAAEEAAKTLQSLSTSLAGCPAGSTGAQPAVSSRPRRGEGASSLQAVAEGDAGAGPSGDASCHLQRSGSEVKRVGALDIMAVAADLNGTSGGP